MIIDSICKHGRTSPHAIDGGLRLCVPGLRDAFRGMSTSLVRYIDGPQFSMFKSHLKVQELEDGMKRKVVWFTDDYVIVHEYWSNLTSIEFHQPTQAPYPPKSPRPASGT